MSELSHERRIRGLGDESAYPAIAADLVHRDERSRWAITGKRRRRGRQRDDGGGGGLRLIAKPLPNTPWRSSTRSRQWRGSPPAHRARRRSCATEPISVPQPHLP